jgi:hypothetical protein
MHGQSMGFVASALGVHELKGQKGRELPGALRLKLGSKEKLGNYCHKDKGWLFIWCAC